MAVAAQRNEARLVQAQQRLEALATAAERAAAGASGAVGAIAHPDIQQTIADEKESRRTAAVSEFRAQRRAVDAELADLRTTRARAVDSLRKERADRAKTDTAREAALAAVASAASRLTARRVAKAVRETEDRAFSAHALALEDAATAQQQRHRLCGNQPVRRVHRKFFTKSFRGDDVATLARSSDEEPASPRHRAGVASMAWRTTRRFRTNTP